MRAWRLRSQGGLTLLELMVSLAVVVSLAIAGLPVYREWQDSTRLRQAMTVVVDDLRTAQSEASKRRRDVSVSFRMTDNGWCYGLHVGGECECSVVNSCNLGRRVWLASNSSADGVTISPAVSDHRFSFQPHRGTVTAGHVTLSSRENRQVRVVVSGLGRIRVCNPDRQRGLGGYPVC